MNNKPNFPEEIDCYSKEYSGWADLKVNRWMFAALLISFASDGFFPNEIKTWPEVWRIIAAIAPFFFILLWARDFTRWVRGMDELHRRITQNAMTFAVSAAFFIVALWHVVAGIWQPLAFNFYDPSNVWVCLSLVMIFYFRFGYYIFNRRYK